MRFLSSISLIVSFLILCPISKVAEGKAPAPFRFHLFVESHGVDPQVTLSAMGNYLFSALYRGLYSYHSVKGLLLAGASSCVRSPMKLTCVLSPDHRWSSGARITAADYVASFRRLSDPELGSPQSGILASLKNAPAILAGHKKPTELGVSAPAPYTVEFEFAQEDPEFEYKLIHPALSPLPPGGFPKPKDAAKLIVSGPYLITQWKAGSWIHLEPNRYFKSAVERRPPVEAWFVEEDSTALRLYESGRLNFLRRLVSSEIPRFKGKAEFHQIPMARFDYIGFGPELDNKPELREALVRSVDFPTFRRLFDTKTSPGCPSLPARLEDKVVCQSADFAKARKLARAAGEPKLQYHFSRMGGEDIARAAEWFQGQWRKNAGVEVELTPQEQGVYLGQLKIRPPAIFRKGLSLDRPTCLAALEVFFKGETENYLHFDDPEYERLARLSASAKSPDARKLACRQAIERLLNSNRLIPLGEMYFTVLADTKFRGWDLNELNQFDLSELEAVP